jgi:protein phosphatase
MGTTAVAAAVRGSEVYVANVGDSRAYVLRQGEFVQITKDHSFVQEQIDANILTPEAARTHPKRNVITRALGHQAQVEVDTFEGQLSPGDLLLLCSDGLSGTMNDNELQAILSQSPPQEAVMRLINEANLRGGPDNISAVIVQGLRFDPAVPAAMEVTPGTQPTPAMVARPPSEAPAGPTGGRGRLVVAGLAVFLLLAVVAAGAFFVFRGSKDDQTSAFTPASPLTTTPAHTPTAVTPSSSPAATVAEITDTPIPIVTSGTITNTSTPVGTPTETADAPTGTPTESLNPSSTPLPTPSPTVTSTPCQAAPPDTLVAPQPLASFPVNSAVTFSWSGGRLCRNQVWQVTINSQPTFCPATVENQVTCNLTEAGQHLWRVEVWRDDGQRVDRIVSEERGIVIMPAPTDPPAQPTAQPKPPQPQPTDQPEEPPTRTPPSPNL